jgi:hypothetical protein
VAHEPIHTHCQEEGLPLKDAEWDTPGPWAFTLKDQSFIPKIRHMATRSESAGSYK